MEASTKKKQPLFAIAVEVRAIDGQITHTSIEYIHADDTANALYKFRLTCPNPRKFHVVSVGPVIGFHVEDKQGLILSV